MHFKINTQDKYFLICNEFSFSIFILLFTVSFEMMLKMNTFKIVTRFI